MHAAMAQPAFCISFSVAVLLVLQSASNSGYFEVVLKLVQHGSPWRLKGEADVVKLLGKKTSYK